MGTSIASRLPWVAGAAALCTALAACSPTPTHAPIKKPNDELIVGDYERRGGDGETAIRFASDGTYRVVKNKSSFDQEPPLGAGTWKIGNDQLSLSAQKGMCAEADQEREATYKVVISKVGIRFEKVNDDCGRRSKMDGQTWWRLR
jgi:hypothetical protein